MLTFGRVGRLPRVLHLLTTEMRDQNTIAKRERRKPEAQTETNHGCSWRANPKVAAAAVASERDEERPEKRTAWRRGGEVLYGKGGEEP